MQAKITLFLIALAITFTAQDAHAVVVKKEQSWIEQIFSNDSEEMIQKSPFGQPQPRQQNNRYQRPQNQTYKTTEESRTQTMKPRETPRKLGRHTPQNDLTQTYAERVKTMRQQRLKAMNKQSGLSSSGVND